MIVPTERNGPKGISDFIVRLFLKLSKCVLDAIFFKSRAARAKAAPIQKANTKADSPCTKPKKKPKTNIYFTSPKPNQLPLEIKNIKQNGRASTMPAKTKNTEKPETK